MTRDLSPSGDWHHNGVQVNGISMHYVREGHGVPLMLVHGWPEFWWTWHKNIPQLAERFDVIAPDLRGFGETKRAAAEEHGPDDHARDLLELADKLGLQSFGLVSHDVGAYVAQSIARLSPDRVQGLFFFNAPHPGIGRRWAAADHIQQIWYQSFNQLPVAEDLVGGSELACRTYFEGILDHWIHSPPKSKDVVDVLVDNMWKPGNIAGGFAWYRATHAARMGLVRDGAPTLKKIDIPTQVFWGRHDPIMNPNWVDTLPDYFRDPIVEIAENAGHFVHFEQPKQSNERVVSQFEMLMPSTDRD